MAQFEKERAKSRVGTVIQNVAVHGDLNIYNNMGHRGDPELTPPIAGKMRERSFPKPRILKSALPMKIPTYQKGSRPDMNEAELVEMEKLGAGRGGLQRAVIARA